MSKTSRPGLPEAGQAIIRAPAAASFRVRILFDEMCQDLNRPISLP
jgi:hypothetical protein